MLPEMMFFVMMAIFHRGTHVHPLFAFVATVAAMMLMTVVVSCLSALAIIVVGCLSAIKLIAMVILSIWNTIP